MDFKIKVLGGEERQAPKEDCGDDTHNDIPVNSHHKIQNFNFTETAEEIKEDPYTLEELEESFTGDFKPGSPGIFYLAGLGILIPLMLVLVIVYMGIAGGLGWVMYYCWPQSYFELGGGFEILKVCYTVAFVVAALVLLFMIKPIFHFKSREKLIKVDPEKEPLIYEYVNLLCDKINAPRPSEINLTFEPNAAASFKNGFLSMFSNDMRLLLGIPFIETMSMRELTGILAHEIGHFSQNAGMKLTYVIRSTYYWFAQIVFSRDKVDEVVFNLRKNNRFFIVRLIFKFVYIFVAIPKAILWVLIMVAHFLGNFMLRQMEYDADRFKAQAGGSEQFEKTALKVYQLNFAFDKSMSGLQTALDTKRVVDDFPGYISASRVILTKNEQKDIEDYMRTGKGRIGDTHPAMKNRIKHALKANEPGLFTLESPARRLFKDLGKIKKQITIDLYKDKFGKDWEKDLKCVPAYDLLNEMREMGKSWDALDGFYQGVISFSDLVEFKQNDQPPGGDVLSTIAALETLRKEMNKDIHKLREDFYEYKSILDFKSRCAMARKLVDMNLEIQASLLVGEYVNRSNMNKYNAEVNTAIAKVEPSLKKHREMAHQRILGALKLLRNDEFRVKMEHGEACLKNLKPILNNLKMFNSIHMPIMNLKNNFISVLVIVDTAYRDAAFSAGLVKLSDNLRSILVTQREKMEKIPFPFAHSQGNISLAEYAIEEIPHEDDFIANFNTAGDLFEKISNLYYRTLGQLIVIVEQVEMAAELGPLPEFIPIEESKKS